MPIYSYVCTNEGCKAHGAGLERRVRVHQRDGQCCEACLAPLARPEIEVATPLPNAIHRTYVGLSNGQRVEGTFGQSARKKYGRSGLV